MNLAYRFGQLVGAILVAFFIGIVIGILLGVPAYLAAGFFLWGVPFETAVVGLLAYAVFYSAL